jgi:hypothetical protein
MGAAANAGGVLTGSTDTAGAARYLSLGVSTLEKLRVSGGGPLYNKLTDGPNGRVSYDYADLEAWKAERKRRNTAGTSPLKGQRRSSPESAPTAAAD